jgi:hypothetical protein
LTRIRLLRLTAAVSAVTCVLATFALAVTAMPAHAAPPTPKLGADIEVYAPYQGQSICDPHAKPGVLKFHDLLLKTYPTTGDSGITRACSIGGKSEHKEGRAWDWRVNVKSSAEVAKVADVFRWLFATDSYGNTHAVARRLGIMYIIWNAKIWNAGNNGWKAYDCSGTTDCHMDHVHFSFGWAGALAKTSYWTGKVSPVIPAPGQPIIVEFPQQVRVDPRRAAASATGFAVTAGRHYRVTVTGTYRYGPGATTLADAECSRRAYSVLWRRWTAAEGLPSHNDLDLSVGGQAMWSPTVDTGQGCNGYDHRYTMTYTPTKSGPLSFVVNGAKPGSDTSTLSVTVDTA